MNTPNKLTVLRILLVPFFVAFLLLNSVKHHFLIATIIFMVAAFTDHLDGKIARERGLVTNFGKFADPLADKIMTMAAFISFVELGLIGSCAAIIILAREFMVTSIRLVAASSGKVVAANMWGKAKTVSQILAILITMVVQYIKELVYMGLIRFNGINSDLYFCELADLVSKYSIWISVLLTVVSGIIYVLDNKEFIKQTK